MNIEHLRAFLKVAAASSFQLAAEMMHITQSTTSARIKTPEDRFNQSLSICKHNDVESTSAGYHLHKGIGACRSSIKTCTSSGL